MKRIAVYCGSRIPNNPAIIDQAVLLGNLLVKHDIELVFGGAKVGIMGIIADTMKAQGGRIIGVMPQVLVDQEILREDLDEKYVVDGMHPRKQKMMDLADAFIAFPGGCGTMEEIFEVITWNQIGIHNKPYGFINIDGYYQGIYDYLQTAYKENLTSQENINRIIFTNTVEEFLEKII